MVSTQKAKRFAALFLCFMMIFILFSGNIGIAVSAAVGDGSNFSGVNYFVLMAEVDGVTKYVAMTDFNGAHDMCALTLTTENINEAEIFFIANTGDSGYRARPLSEPSMMIFYDRIPHVGNEYMLACKVAGGGLWETIIPRELPDGTYSIQQRNSDQYVYANTANKLVSSGASLGTGAIVEIPERNRLLRAVAIDVKNPENPASAIELNETSLELTHSAGNPGQAILTAMGYATANGQPATNSFLSKLVAWSSSNANVATVANGVVTTNSPGETVITASIGNIAGTCAVIVTGDAIPVSGVSLNSEAQIVPAELTYQLTASILPADATNKNIRWFSSDENVAKVDANGLVSALRGGTAIITVITDDGNFMAECVVTVTERPAVVSLADIKTLVLKANRGGSAGYRYVGQLDNRNLVTLGNDSTLEQAAVFDVKTAAGKSGLLSRVNGMLVCAEASTPRSLIARTSGANNPDAWEWFEIEVLADGKIALIAKGADHSASTPYVYTTHASNPSNVGATMGPVRADASVDAVTTGSNSGRVQRIEVEVLEYTNPKIPAESVVLNMNQAVIDEYEGTVRLNALGYLPANASNTFLTSLVSWSSSDETVAVVDSNGVVTGIGRGTVNIIASAGGASGICEITVDIKEVPPEGIEVSPASRNLTLGFTAQLNATVLPLNNTSRKVAWESSDAAVATVDGNGVITPLSLGEVIITAKTTNGFTASSVITVTAPSDGKPAVYKNSVTGSDDVIVYAKNVLDFGASGDGASDNTAAFQAAINAAQAAGGGVVFAPAGIYAFNGRIEIPSGVTLRGEWLSPLNGGGKGEGTILAVYGGRGTSNEYDLPTNGNSADGNPSRGYNTAARSFIGLGSSGTVRDISFWWPEQTIDNVTPYPFAVGDDGGGTGNDVINIMNVTMYNAYNGVMSYGTHGCTTVRNLFGTFLNKAVSEDSGYDIGRMENIYADPSYWADSGFAGAPDFNSVAVYTRANAIGMDMWQDDWGYLYNLNLNHLNIGLRLSDGNYEAASITTRNVNYGIYIRSISYPGFQLANSDLEASVNCIYYNVSPWARNSAGRTRTDGSSKGWLMQSYEQVAASNVRFGGNPETAVVMNLNMRLSNPCLSLQNCAFENWQNWAVDADQGSLILMGNSFEQSGKAINLTNRITAANILGNEFADYSETTIAHAVPANRINIDNGFEVDYPAMPEYEYEWAPVFKPANPGNFYNVLDEGVTANGLNGTSGANRRTDQTEALQAALNKAAAAGGGTVYMPGGAYWIAGEITVPVGVELRGSYDASHTGKTGFSSAQTPIGTVIVVYGDSATAEMSDKATVNVSGDASLRGVTFYYPAQTISGNSSSAYGSTNVASALYPWAIRGLGDNCSIQNNTLVNAYNGIDLMTHTCNGAILADMNAYALGTQVQMGGGMVGGWVQDVHFNQCNWQQSSNWITTSGAGSNPGGTLDTYAGAKIQGFKYGAMKDVYNFQNFTITVDRAVWMVEEPEYADGPTGGVFSGVFNGFAFDSNQKGLDIENAGEVIFINAMCVTDLPRNGWVSGDQYTVQGGPNIRTGENFTGTLYYYNGDSWGGGTRIAEINGGTVYLIQYNAWSTNRAVVNGGKLYMYGSLYMENNRDSLIVNEGADRVVFIGNISRASFSITNRAPYRLFGKYNLNTNGSAVPEYGQETFIIEPGKSGDSVKVTITNIRQNQQPVSGTVEVIEPAQYGSLFSPIPFKDLGFEESIEIVFPVITADSIKLKITADNGKTFTEIISVDVAYATREIGETPALIMDSQECMKGGMWDGPEDLSSASYFAWDENNLYAKIIVTDDMQFNNKSGQNIWDGDSVQIGVDLSGDGTNTTRNELGFALNNNGETVITSWNRLPGVNAPITNMTAVITRDGEAGTTTYNLTIPFTVVHHTPSSLDLSKIGISIQLNDVDGEDGNRIWGEPKAEQLKNPPLFTTLYLMETGEYEELITKSAREAVGKALESESDFDKAMARNFTALVKNSQVKSELNKLLDSLDEKVTLVKATATAYVEKLNGNKNNLTIIVREEYSDGSVIDVERTFSIKNNAADTYTVGAYTVYVDTKGNTQIREIYIVK